MRVLPGSVGIGDAQRGGFERELAGEETHVVLDGELSDPVGGHRQRGVALVVAHLVLITVDRAPAGCEVHVLDPGIHARLEEVDASLDVRANVQCGVVLRGGRVGRGEHVHDDVDARHRARHVVVIEEVPVEGFDAGGVPVSPAAEHVEGADRRSLVAGERINEMRAEESVSSDDQDLRHAWPPRSRQRSACPNPPS